MDWSTIGGLVGQAAPTIGGLLGGLIPFPGGAILGQVAGKVLAEALGVTPTPDAVHTAITSGDPATVNAALAAADAKMQAEVDKFKAQLEDVQDARATGIKYAVAGSQVQWAPTAVSVIVGVGFFGTLALLLKGGINFNETIGQVLLILIGSLVSYMNQVVNYWLGSSAGSTDKSNQIAAMATTAATASAKAVAKK
ncbi:hypothetical protein [Bradyrhizobium lablabi]|uniref:Holin of 3TMs, for gene-transfer release n=1 Tax=Bradyrhizobium lablabi TaxID=722472 RepID=A0A1H5JL31_9BRAD|nr:hypothetical protein [Bradyrhizobium lablabi]SEE51764.1 hypothetical protein SAMN05444171_7821 [Bradyrhizobium lablabi]SEE53275.1 hypothetical protein SAMN05444171_7888 [Bradyrhizobium lablabi]